MARSSSDAPVMASEAWPSSFKVTKVWITSHSLVMTRKPAQHSSWRGDLATWPSIITGFHAHYVHSQCRHPLVMTTKGRQLVILKLVNAHRRLKIIFSWFILQLFLLWASCIESLTCLIESMITFISSGSELFILI